MRCSHSPPAGRSQDRWCPKCEKLFVTTVIVERVGTESTSQETRCPNCGTQRQRFLQIPRD